MREYDAPYTDPERPSLADEVIAPHRHLRLDNSRLTPDEAAGRILAWLDPCN